MLLSRSQGRLIVYTQCPKCETVFKLSAEVLRAAAGQVRCGRCGEVFSALARLSEDADVFMDTESMLDLEARADSILESAAALKVAEAVAKDYEDFVPPGTEIARLQVLDYWAEDDQESRPERRTEEGGAAETDQDLDEAPDDGAPAARGDLDAPLSDTDATGEREIPLGNLDLGEIPAGSLDLGPPIDIGSADAPGAAEAAAGAEGLDDASLEFTLPPGDLDRIFIESRPHGIPHAVAQAALDMAARPAVPIADTPVVGFPATTDATSTAAAGRAATASSTPAEASAATASSDPADSSAAAESSTATASLPAMAHSAAAPVSGSGVLPMPPPSARDTMITAELPVHPERAAMQLVGAADRRARRTTGLEVPESVRHDLLQGLESGPTPDPGLPELEELRRPQAPRGPFFAWLAAGVALALLLGAQALHRNAESLAEHAEGPLGAVLRSLSGAMGTQIAPPANLSAYQVRQWGVSGEPAANGILRLRASILNGAAQLQPYPLLRVTLADRFGKRIGSRDFQPAEYLGKPTARLMTPGERADALLDILDPGKNAEGFEIDVCLRRAARAICANDAAPQVKP
ncbi:MAG TPA: zinc-ribbon and DUF3426 domain-containing protein [Steroidobacteraceae bacterium]|nr:zinc-ribbon and DUF3426 domain-containing protein [Steroidobacteraceae bacterium]